MSFEKDGQCERRPRPEPAACAGKPLEAAHNCSSRRYPAVLHSLVRAERGPRSGGGTQRRGKGRSWVPDCA
eukprot:448293-Alexandrium_andersonii.AAC.1